ncbi:MAG TPA: VWA domain-containing protein [Terracidiphilus sp.]|jgi:VWFA-related protein
MLTLRTTALGLVAVFCLPTAALAQFDDSAPLPPLQINARNVLVDVVVTDKKGAAVHGLPKEGFQVFENGKPQKVEFFEEHSPAQSNTATAPQLPPNTFTNVPRAEPNQAINLLLMDALNTNLTDQMFVRKEAVKYLSSIPPDLRVGVFLLGDRLRIIQGFTDNSTLLRASIKRLASKPMQAGVEGTPDELASQSNSLNDLSTMAAGPGGAQMADMIAAMQSILDQQTEVQQNQQLRITLDALQTIAHYVAAVPGRKNLIWFVGSFPRCLPRAPRDSPFGCPYPDEIEKTWNALAAARVSVYPVDAGGVGGTPNSNIGGKGTDQTGSLVPGTHLPGQTGSSPDLVWASFNASERWAEATGGKASHNNDFKGELADDIENGSSYYTLAYTPTDSKEIGRERKIEIRTPDVNYKLAYRRAYFERKPAEIKASAAPDHDPLRPLMDRGMPDFSDLKFRVHIEPDSGQPASDGSPIGDNPSLKAPLRRYSVRFFLSPEELNLVAGSDGVSRAPIEVALIAYSQRGDSLNWILRSIDLAIRPDQMALAQTDGIPFHFDFDIPPGDVYLRAGVYDPSTQRAGTLEIPVALIRANAQISAK